MDGRGVQQDELAAFSYFQKACTLGDTRACPNHSAGSTRAAPARSPDEGARLHLLLAFGLQFGGEPLVEIQRRDGQTSQLQAGDALNISLGALLEPYRGKTHALQFQATGGYNYAGAKARNGSAELTHWPSELLAFYYHRPYRLRIGGGPQYQLTTSLTGTGVIPRRIAFDNALGGVFQAEWLPKTWLSVYARYTLIGYTPAGSSESISGNAFGLGMGLFALGVD
jgi:TPR repeat protein